MEKEIYAYPHKYYTDGLSEVRLLFDEDKQKYEFEIEKAISFDDETQGPVKFMESILSDFTEWMNENGYQTEGKISYWDFFDSFGVAREYTSIEQAYGVFKRMVRGFVEK